MILIVLVPRVAEAQGWWRWIEQLSGPGPLMGPEFEVGLYCIKEPDPKSIGSQGLFCDADPNNAVKAAIRLDVAWMWGKNNLTYPAGTDVPDNVHAFSWLAAVDVAPKPWLEFGAGFGAVRFSNTPGTSFSKPAIEPVRVIWKPFAMKSGLTRQEQVRRGAFQIRYRGIVLPSGFTAEDFGAVPGTFDAGAEFINSVSFVVNVVNLLR
jgi:hypothetical protein